MTAMATTILLPKRERGTSDPFGVTLDSDTRGREWCHVFVSYSDEGAVSR